ncbi:MAG: aspartate aminotransferase family protein [Candidatus Pelagadaptatus aseana]|uniref:aspartate aminotransferase family protein n=1 Tax=Candidatus Pelagadaptatus aseana TaxID=3120508 RepID=UPI0039B27B2A
MSTASIMNTYGERKLTFTKGEGCYLWDKQGNRYLDALSGIAVCGLGHAHPEVAQTIAEQASTLLHTSNLYLTDPGLELADNLCAETGMEKVFFSNSGAEANEAAIKIARKYGNDKGITKPVIITMDGSFHGRTMATLTATGNSKVKTGFTPLLEGFVHVPYDNIDELKAAATSDVVAVLVEPVQGEGGVNIPATDYLNQLRELCDQNDWLLMLDEIQTGNCRTGRHFAFQHNQIQPDVVTTAKGLGNGLPIGACMARGKAAEILVPGTHGSTYGGNPLVCQGALTVQKVLKRDRIDSKAMETGNYLLDSFNQAIGSSALVKEIRGMGMMIGIELTMDCPELVGKAADKGLLINVTAGSVIRLLPPLTLSKQQADDVAEIVSSLVNELEAQG